MPPVERTLPEGIRESNYERDRQALGVNLGAMLLVGEIDRAKKA